MGVLRVCWCGGLPTCLAVVNECTKTETSVALTIDNATTSSGFLLLLLALFFHLLSFLQPFKAHSHSLRLRGCFISLLTQTDRETDIHFNCGNESTRASFGMHFQLDRSFNKEIFYIIYSIDKKDMADFEVEECIGKFLQYD